MESASRTSQSARTTSPVTARTLRATPRARRPSTALRVSPATSMPARAGPSTAVVRGRLHEATRLAVASKESPVRTTVAAMACLAFVAAACSGSSGNSSAAGTTGGPQGTTGGPLRLAAGKPCAFNAACASGVLRRQRQRQLLCGRLCHQRPDLRCHGLRQHRRLLLPAGPHRLSLDVHAGSTLSQNSCNGAGACVAADAGPCPGHVACTSDGICNPGCTSSMQCASGFYCNQDTCQPALKTGACSEDDDCTSGQCGTIGIGHCCTAACANASAPCGAPDCGADSGACLYPTTATPCGSVLQSCTGNTQINATHCDGAGTCLTPQHRLRRRYVCGSNACLTS